MPRTMEWQTRDYLQCIYGLHDGSGKIRYIGKSAYAAQALSNFRTATRKDTYPNLEVYKWINEIGLENVQITIIEKLMTKSPAVGVERRKHFIQLFSDSADPQAPLLNMYQGDQ